MAAAQPIFSNTRPIAFGERGARVQWVQEALNKHGYRIAIDGQFGSQTLAAVRAFQTAKRLKVDGLVGTQTGSALASNLILTSSSGSSAANYAGPPPAQEGSNLVFLLLAVFTYFVFIKE